MPPEPDAVLTGAGPHPAASGADDTNIGSPFAFPQGAGHPGGADGVGALVGGRYRFVGPLGEGGMGTVFLARQTEPVERDVAVKVIRAGMDSKAVVARFEAERQALALMDHPNIAKVLDAGTTPAGRPFFAMELVRGEPITDYCDRLRLTPRQRLELFVPVCQAIQHAHQKGVIHRDIKPSNVLVATYDDRPVVKVIDFGVAKATGPGVTALTLDTAAGGLVGTPQYMSPEQATADHTDIDTRSDVYSLGVLLYELLAGSPPFAKRQLEEAGLLEVLRVIREDEPPRPSTKLSTADTLPSLSACRGTEPKKLTGLLRGELDWVVMKALEKDRARRYETASAFAADVLRYLADEPVTAGRPGRWYRAGKFVRRNRRPVLAAGLVLVALVGGLAGTSWGLVRARAAERLAGHRLTEVETARAETEQALAGSEAARGKAEIARKQADAVAGYLADAFQKPDPAADGRQLKVVDLLEQSASKLDADRGMDALTRARLQDALGRTFFGLGLPDKAVALQERALAAVEREHGRDSPEALDVMHRLSVSLGHADRPADAIRVGEAALAGRQARLGPDHPDTLLTMTQLAGRYWDANRLDDAVPMAEKALAGQRKLWGPGHDDLPNSISNLGMLLQAAGRTADAVRLHEEAVAMRKAAKGPDHADTLLAVNLLGRAYLDAGRTADAIALQRDTAARMETTFGPDHPRTLGAMSKLAQALCASGKAAEALPVCEKALALARGAKAPDAEAVLQALQDLAVAYGYLNRPAESLARLREVMTTAAASYGPTHDKTITATHDLGVALRQADRPAEAVPVFEQALATRKASGPEGGEAMQRTITQLASAYEAVGRATDAIPLLEGLLALQKTKLDPDHRDLLVTMANLGLSYGSAGRAADAVRVHEQAAAAFRKKFGPTHPDAQAVTRYLAAAYLKAGRPDAAAATYRELLAAARPTVPADSPELAPTLAGLGEALLTEQKFAEAEGALRECLTIREKTAPDDWRTFHTRSLLGAAVSGQKKFAEAEPLLTGGYEGLKARAGKVPGSHRAKPSEAAGRVVRLYEAWGKPAEAAKWRSERDGPLPESAPPPRPAKR